MQLQLYGKKIWVFRQPIDFRASIDRLSALIVSDIKQDPQGGIFLFLYLFSHSYNLVAHLQKF